MAIKELFENHTDRVENVIDILNGLADAPTQTKTVTAGTSAVTVTPDEGYFLEGVTVDPTPSQSKTVTPVPEGMTVTPDTGKLLSQVILNGFELPSPEGEYIWKKWKIRTITNPTITLTRLMDKVVQVASNDVDLTSVTEEFFGGFVYSSDPTLYYFTYRDNNLYLYSDVNVQESTVTYNPSSKIFNLSEHNYFAVTSNFSYTGNKTVHDIFEGYVVSDNINEYPDKAEQNCYWYEKVEGYSIDKLITAETFGCTEIAIDTISFSYDAVAKSNSIQHSLGRMPRFFYLFTDTEITDTNYIINAGGIGLAADTDNSHSISISYNSYQTSFGSTSLNVSSSTSSAISKDMIRINSSNYKAGVEYTLITMA